MDITKLYHCTTIQNLENILHSCEFWPSYCLEKADYLEQTYEFAFAMVCFADLMNAEVKLHLEKFQKDSYIQMSKTWARKNGLSNVIYYGRGSVLSATFKHLVQEIIAQENNVENADMVRYLGLLMAYFKQYEGEYWNDNKNCWSEKTTQFYTEREWRYIPIVQNYEAYYLDPKDFKDKDIRNRKRNQLIEHNYALKFEWNDIESIGVIGWSKKIKIVNFLMKHSIGFIEAWSKIKVLEKWHF